jgi:hypothetical protein
MSTLPTNPAGPTAQFREPGRAVTGVDLFAAANAALFCAMCFLRYMDRFIAYRGAANLHEFFIYSSVLLGVIGFMWRHFRHHRVPTSILILLQIGIVMHFAGGFAQIDGRRLYEFHLFGGDGEWTKYDKLVHFANASIVTVLIHRLLGPFPPGLLGRIMLVAIVLGLGAFVEVVEYLAYLAVPNTDVGSYDNNLQDMIANVMGATLASAATGITARLRHHDPTRKEDNSR